MNLNWNDNEYNSLSRAKQMPCINWKKLMSLHSINWLWQDSFYNYFCVFRWVAFLSPDTTSGLRTLSWPAEAADAYLPYFTLQWWRVCASINQVMYIIQIIALSHVWSQLKNSLVIGSFISFFYNNIFFVLKSIVRESYAKMSSNIALKKCS